MIVVTVPHAHCWKPVGPEENKIQDWKRGPCDKLAAPAAEILRKWYLPRAHFLLADICRSEIDLNRAPSRKVTPFRRQLTELVQKGRVAAVLDLHSYGTNAHGRIGSIAFPDPLVILEPPPKKGKEKEKEKEDLPCLAPSPSRFASYMRECIYRETGFKPRIFNSTLGDIPKEMQEVGVPCLTIELRSSLDEKSLHLFMSAIATGYRQGFEKNAHTVRVH